jgi:hypothetical protein
MSVKEDLRFTRQEKRREKDKKSINRTGFRRSFKIGMQIDTWSQIMRSIRFLVNRVSRISAKERYNIRMMLKRA